MFDSYTEPGLYLSCVQPPYMKEDEEDAEGVMRIEEVSRRISKAEDNGGWMKMFILSRRLRFWMDGCKGRERSSICTIGW